MPCAAPKAVNVSKSFRPAHAKGHLLSGTFTPTPTPQASLLPLHRPALRPPLDLPHRPLLLLHKPALDPRHRAHGQPARPRHPLYPETVRFVHDAKPSPASFATERYFGVNAYVFSDAAGRETLVRYRIEPAAGVQTLAAAELARRDASYLFDELVPRLAGGPVVFRLTVQVAGADDATVLWPEDREVVELGLIGIEESKGEESLREQKEIVFDPVPRVTGVATSKDPLLDVRANVYLISGRQRREAEVAKA
ncbi:heme-dependent catalase [Karstenula rhodostoma CBS 690.94]|uniref:Heme-dependent catalase n=1 Tax=Karstenula rhodostoma CBS 690.94 TaxID=1392251 RepID=A0A9P4P8Q7_9PLEO|nr:heme-dependent catalase [Karstenula rhodostoma CBS 690.94]